MQRLLHARTIEEYMKWAERIDREEGLDKWRCVWNGVDVCGRRLGVGVLGRITPRRIQRYIPTHTHTLDVSSEDDSDLPQADMLKLTIAKLDKSLKTHDVQKLQFTLLNGLLKVR